MPILNKYFFSITLINAISSLFNFIFIKLLIEILQPSDYANYTYILTLIAIPTTLFCQPIANYLKPNYIISISDFELTINFIFYITIFSSFLFFFISKNFLLSFFYFTTILFSQYFSIKKTFYTIHNNNKFLFFTIFPSFFTLLTILLLYINKINDYKYFLIFTSCANIPFVIYFIFRNYLILVNLNFIIKLKNLVTSINFLFLFFSSIFIYFNVFFYKLILNNENINLQGKYFFNYDFFSKIFQFISFIYITNITRFIYNDISDNNKFTLFRSQIKSYSILLILFSFFLFFTYKLYFTTLFNINYILDSCFSIFLQIFSIAISTYIGFFEIYLNSYKKFKYIFYIYIFYIFSTVFLYFILENVTFINHFDLLSICIIIINILFFFFLHINKKIL